MSNRHKHFSRLVSVQNFILAFRAHLLDSGYTTNAYDPRLLKLSKIATLGAREERTDYNYSLNIRDSLKRIKVKKKSVLDGYQLDRQAVLSVANVEHSAHVRC